MKKTFTCILALTLCMLGMSVQTFAEAVPAPAGRWTFDDASNLLKCDEGTLNLLPAIIPVNKEIQMVESVTDANIVTVAGPLDENKAILVPKASALKVARAEGAAATKNYSIMIDFKVDAIGPFHSFYQTSATNSNDGDFFMQENGKVGISAMGGYSNTTCVADKWYRLIIVNEGESLKGYLNGKLVIASTDGKWNGRWEIDSWGFYLFCDEDGEDEAISVAEVAYWEQALTAEEIVAYGNIKTNEFMEISGTPSVKLFNDDYFIISVNTNTEVKFDCPDWIEPIDVTPFNGEKDYTFRTAGVETRSGDVKVIGGDFEKTFTVKQTFTGGGIPEAAGKWTFDDASDLFKCDGSMTMIPAIIPAGNSIQLMETAAAANIEVTEGPTKANAAIKVPATSALRVNRGDGCDVPTPYFALMMDIWVPTIKAESGRHYNALLQTQIDNNDADGDLFIRDGKVGLGGKLGYGGAIAAQTWHRVIFQNNNKEVSIYIDGQKVLSTTTINDQWCLRGAFNLFCDNDFPPEDDEILVAEVRFWETPLTSNQISQLGGVDGVQKVHIGASGYSTFVSFNSDVTIEGAKAYTARKSGQVVILDETDVVPQGMGVVLVGAEGDYAAVPYNGALPTVTSELLFTEANTYVFNPAFYVLSEVDGVVGFYQAEVGSTIADGKGYLYIPDAAESKGFVIRFGDETGIQNVPSAASTVPGQEIFDLSGRRVEKATKGIYIINGKKVVVK
ncbi:MAG: hypothetical protein IJT48_01415 [Bacteroidaceae bacterium]|nr:hypothetical protein [Bacteroidaceae bacterium]